MSVEGLVEVGEEGMLKTRGQVDSVLGRVICRGWILRFSW